LNNNYKLYSKLNNRDPTILGMDKEKYNICFGCQCFINIHFLERLEMKYKITNLINAVRCRKDRCSLERVMGLLFNEEYSQLKNIKSLFGEIRYHYKSFVYHYSEYKKDFEQKKIVHPVLKIWTGR
jgi:hypothetical protein